MSRCFPFPPPGYEKKPIPGDANILKKEKTKEKKHKDKKDKERKEGKDKKDKEKSDRKHREKKDKKEKHKDKEKHKEKDQEKGSTSGEKRVLGQSENNDGAKSYQNEKERGKEKKESSSSTSADKKQNRAKSHQSEKARGKEKKESISTSEEKRQIGPFDYCNGEKLHQKVEKSRDKRNTSNEKKTAVQIQGHNGGDNKPVQHSFADKDTQDSKFMLEFSKRISVEEKGSGSQLVEGTMRMGLEKDERTDRFAVRDTCMVVEGKEKIKDEQADIWKINGERIHHEEKSNGTAMSQNLTVSIQNKTGVSNLTEKVEQRMEGKEKSKEREIDDKRRDKRKSKHRDKQNQGSDKKREKEKRKEDKAKKEHRKSEKDNLRNNDDIVGTPNNTTPHISKDNNIAATEGNLKKRKDIEKNGFLHENVIRPEKMPRLNPYPLSENGQELEPSKTISPLTPQKQGTDKHLEVYNKDTPKNGLTGPHQLPVSAPQPSRVIAEASRILPHPDMKYLSKVLSVPQVPEWSDVDDQEWLFNNEKSLSSKSDVDLIGVDQGQQVWAEALRIESADVYALPYVIPY